LWFEHLKGQSHFEDQAEGKEVNLNRIFQETGFDDVKLSYTAQERVPF
jgi:hypothetical protein